MRFKKLNTKTGKFVKGNYCYYITYTYKTNESTHKTPTTCILWKASLKNGKTTKVRTVKNHTLRFNGTKAVYHDWDANKYVYYTLN